MLNCESSSILCVQWRARSPSVHLTINSSIYPLNERTNIFKRYTQSHNSLWTLLHMRDTEHTNRTNFHSLRLELEDMYRIVFCVLWTNWIRRWYAVRTTTTSTSSTITMAASNDNDNDNIGGKPSTNLKEWEKNISLIRFYKPRIHNVYVYLYRWNGIFNGRRIISCNFHTNEVSCADGCMRVVTYVFGVFGWYLFQYRIEYLCLFSFVARLYSWDVIRSTDWCMRERKILSLSGCGSHSLAQNEPT